MKESKSIVEDCLNKEEESTRADMGYGMCLGDEREVVTDNAAVVL